MEDLEKLLLEGYNKFSENDLRYLVFELGIDTEYGYNRRWSRSNTTIIKVEDRFFSIDWEEGLTENQPHYFGEQPVEVKAKTITKTITETIYIPIK